MATPYRPIAARPFSASLGKCFSRSQRAALGASCSCAKRRTACRISSCCISVGTNVGQGMVGEKPPLFAVASGDAVDAPPAHFQRSEEHTSELQSQSNLVCRLLLEKKKQLRRT